MSYEENGHHFGNYRILRLLESGGQASVYLGQHIFLKRQAAIKILHTSLDEKASTLFLSEAQLLAGLTHPHIIRVLDYAIEQGEPFLVMDYAPNGSLRSRHPAGVPLSVETTLGYLKQVAGALQYAHDHAIIHRDIKPENLLLNEQNELMLSDFGLALLAPSSTFLEKQVLAGTLAYMAPEQLLGKPCFASDQYALACVVYEWLSGTCLFTGTSLEVIGQHLSASAPGLRTKRPSLPLALEAVIARALHKDPEQRFASVEAFARAFENACLPVHNTPPEDPYATLSPPEAATLTAALSAQDGTTPHARPAPSLPPKRVYYAHSADQQNRQHMLQKVYNFWIAGVLEQSLHGAVLLAPNLQEHPEGVIQPWELVLHQSDHPSQALPPGMHILEVYDRVNGELLILGDPGSGKTTLLLELARALLERAHEDEHHPLPVVFNLSSWSEKRQLLQDWLVDELNDKYQVPRKIARPWLQNNQVLLLLDGLDEVAPSARSACVEAINSYRSEHGLLPMVVCSRKSDYFAQARRVLLSSSVIIQPLSLPQIDAYLASAGAHLEPLRKTLPQDRELLELVSTPLMLSILTLAYHDRSVSELLEKHPLDQRQQRLFTTYVEQMLKRRGGKSPYTPQQTIHWLSWLAKQLKRHDQMVYHMERMQPDWLSQPEKQRVFRAIGIRLPAILLGCLIGMWVGGLLVLGRLSWGYGDFSTLPRTTLESGLLGAVLGFLLSGTPESCPEEEPESGGSFWGHILQKIFRKKHFQIAGVLGVLGVLLAQPNPLYEIWGYTLYRGGYPIAWFWVWFWVFHIFLCFAVIGFLIPLLMQKRNARKGGNEQTSGWLSHTWSRYFEVDYLRNAFFAGLIGTLFVLLSLLGNQVSASDYPYTFANLLSFIPTFGVTGLLVTLFLRHRGAEIEPTEFVSWSWLSLVRSFVQLRNVRNSLLVGLFYATFYGIVIWIFSHTPPFTSISLSYWLQSFLSMLAIVSVVSWLLIGLFGGWSGEKLAEHKLTKPNQGMRRSAYYALLFGIISWLVYGAITWLIRYVAAYTPLTRWILDDTWLNSWLIYGSAGALAIALYSGGLACIRHALLRLFLWLGGNMPGRYSHFLDYAAERILLRKVGGGYIFAHRLLLEYFASLQTEPSPLFKKKKGKQAPTSIAQQEAPIFVAPEKPAPITVDQVMAMQRRHDSGDQEEQMQAQQR